MGPGRWVACDAAVDDTEDGGKTENRKTAGGTMIALSRRRAALQRNETWSSARQIIQLLPTTKELVVAPNAEEDRGGAGRSRKISGEDGDDVDGHAIPPEPLEGS